MRTREQINREISDTKESIRYLEAERRRVDRNIQKLKDKLIELESECPNQIKIQWES
jgi:cell division protein FtsB